MESHKPLARAAYALALFLIVFPLWDYTTSVWPPHLGDERWRFGVVGTLSNLLLIPLLGFLIAMATATYEDHRRTRRVLGWICGILAVVGVALVVLFVLDYFQTRTLMNPRVLHVAAVATTNAVVKHICWIIGFTLLSRAGFAGPKAIVQKQRRVVTTEPAASTLIPVGGATRAE